MIEFLGFDTCDTLTMIVKFERNKAILEVLNDSIRVI